MSTASPKCVTSAWRTSSWARASTPHGTARLAGRRRRYAHGKCTAWTWICTAYAWVHPAGRRHTVPQAAPRTVAVAPRPLTPGDLATSLPTRPPASRRRLCTAVPLPRRQVLKGEPRDEKADSYSYGMLLFELMTRELPFNNVSPAQARRTRDPASPIASSLQLSPRCDRLALQTPHASTCRRW